MCVAEVRVSEHNVCPPFLGRNALTGHKAAIYSLEHNIFHSLVRNVVNQAFWECYENEAVS